MANGNAKTTKELPNRVFAIDAENKVAEYGSREVPATATVFSSEAELATVSAGWPARRLVEIWNRLPGVAAVTKFTDRKTAVRRVWQAMSGGGPATPHGPAPAKKEAERKSAAKTQRSSPQAAATKTERIIALLRRPEGATLNAIMAATGWQAHSVRGFISAQLSKRMGLKVKSFKRSGERAYRIRN